MKATFRHSAVVSTLAVALLFSAAPQAHADFPFEFVVGGDSASDDGVTAVRVYKLSGVAREKASPWDLFGGAPGVVLPELLEQIAADARHPKVVTLLFKVGDLRLGAAQAQELAGALAAAKKAGKRVLAYLEHAHLATLVAMAPAQFVTIAREGSVIIPGLRAEVTFYKDLLSTLGVEADIEAVGEYKSAMEPFTRTTLSDAARENLESLVDGLYRSLVQAIAEPRRRSTKKVEAAIDHGLMTAESARRAGLVDDLRYWRKTLEAAEAAAHGTASRAWPAASEAPELGSIFDLFKLLSGDSDEAPDVGPKVAVIVAEGPILEGTDPSDFMNNESVVASDDFIDELARIERDPQIKALVVRINSPGGSAAASDLIWRELDRIDKKIPVIASMGDVAASGGYYIAASARKIFADATTITGSIGVFGGKLVYGDMLDKIGVNTVVIARGKNAGIFSGLGRFSDSEREAIRATMQHVYKTFINRVAKGRNMSFDSVDKVARGRVWTGAQAKEVGLVDRLGGLEDAIREAARLAKLGAGVEVELFPKRKTFFELLASSNDAPRLRFGGMLHQLAGQLPRPIVSSAERLARVVESLLEGHSVLAMMPMSIELH